VIVSAELLTEFVVSGGRVSDDTRPLPRLGSSELLLGGGQCWSRDLGAQCLRFDCSDVLGVEATVLVESLFGDEVVIHALRVASFKNRTLVNNIDVS
jgi:hypothetical protein